MRPDRQPHLRFALNFDGLRRSPGQGERREVREERLKQRGNQGYPRESDT